MEVENFFLDVVNNIFMFSWIDTITLFLTILGSVLHLIAMSASQWVAADSVTHGLWNQCNSTAHYICCQTVDNYLGNTLKMTIPAWLGASRVFKCFGLVTSLVSSIAVVMLLAVPKTRGLKLLRILSSITTILTASFVIIGVAIFGGEYRKQSWLADSYLFSSFGACVTSGILFGISGILTITGGSINRVHNEELPSLWTPMEVGDNLSVVEVLEDTQEHKDVVKHFKRSIGRAGPYMIMKIDRIQNKSLYQQYRAEQDKMKKSNRSGRQIERKLWHGTSRNQVIDSINKEGFNRSYCGRNATVYGQGVYFAVSASYSAADTYSVPDYSGLKSMYLCRVLTGDYTTGDSTMRTPPVKPNAPPHVKYDSVVDDTERPSLFVIFSDNKAYPEYLLTFA